MKVLLVEAQLRSFSRVKDGSVNLGFRTMQEMSPESFALADQYFQKNGFLAFKRDEIDIAEIPDENTQIKGKRSRSQLLRNKLLVLHFKKGGTKDNFTEYYDKVMDGIDQSIQDEIDALGV